MADAATFPLAGGCTCRAIRYEPDRLAPDIHIFTASKQPWVVLPEGVPAVPEYYAARDHWPAASLERWGIARGRQ